MEELQKKVIWSLWGDNRTFYGTILGILNGTIQSNYELSDAEYKSEDESSEEDNH
jgi:hypothetical protein